VSLRISFAALIRRTAAMWLVVGALSGVAGAQRADRSALGEGGGAPDGLREAIVDLARAQLGRTYVYGGENPNGFDCSGLVRYVLGALRLDVPRTASQQSGVGEGVIKDPRRLRPGDLLTFSSGKGVVSHVGIYVGNGRYVHASSKAGRVIESPLARPNAIATIWRGARRLAELVDPTDSSGWRLPPPRILAAKPRRAAPPKPSLVAVPPSLLSVSTVLGPDAVRPSPRTAFVALPFVFTPLGERSAARSGD
jgi:hypothetical protein